MAKDPYQQPEGALIQAAMLRRGVKAPWVARAVQLSEARVRQIVNGVQPVGRSEKVRVVAPADTLAKIAHVLDIAPAQLTDAGRSDAAEVLEAIVRATPHVAAGTINRRELEAIASDPNRADDLRVQAKAYLAVFDAAQALLETDRRLRDAERERNAG